MPNHILVPLIVASALFLQQIDATALATSLPAIGAALGESPVRVHLVLTAYLFALAAFLPVSGWLADRFGARNIFRIAIALFTLSSLACGFAQNLETMVAARICQGLGGAMMVPVGRLILLRSVEKRQLVGALALMTMPALVGPIVGPLLGGFLTTYASWRWIFWINLPVGLLGIVLATVFIRDVPEQARRRFDLLGALLLGTGLAALLFGIDGAATGSGLDPVAVATTAVGGGALVLYWRHSGRHAEPILDLSLFTLPTFRVSMVAGSLFRTGAGAMPFLLPLLFQTRFGYSAFESGAITFVAAVGALGMRSVSARVLRLLGFRTVLVWNALLAAAFMAVGALFQPLVPLAVILAALFLGGVFRSLEMVAINALAFADLGDRQLGHGTTLSTMSQRLSQSVGIGIAAFALHLAAGTASPEGAFPAAFLVAGGLAAAASLLFLRLDEHAGAELAGRTPTEDREED